MSSSTSTTSGSRRSSRTGWLGAQPARLPNFGPRRVGQRVQERPGSPNSGGPANGTLIDFAVQEYDLKTGQLLGTWDALRSFPLSQSKQPGNVSVGGSVIPWDAYHGNSIQLIGSGKFLVSLRNTWAAYLVDINPSNVDASKTEWTLSGNPSVSNFGLPTAARFSWQHDVRLGANNVVTVFDDACCAITGKGKFGPASRASRGLALKLNMSNHTGSFVAQYPRGKSFEVFFLGSTQVLGGGNVLVGWGSTPYFSEFSKSGKNLLDVRWPGPGCQLPGAPAEMGWDAVVPAQRRGPQTEGQDDGLRQLERRHARGRLASAGWFEQAAFVRRGPPCREERLRDGDLGAGQPHVVRGPGAGIERTRARRLESVHVVDAAARRRLHQAAARRRLNASSRRLLRAPHLVGGHRLPSPGRPLHIRPEPVSRHSPGTPRSWWTPRSSNSSEEPTTRSLTVLDTSTSRSWASSQTRSPMCTAIPPMSPFHSSHSPVCNPHLVGSPSVSRPATISCAQRTARVGPSKVATKPSPSVLTFASSEPFEAVARQARCGARAAGAKRCRRGGQRDPSIPRGR